MEYIEIDKNIVPYRFDLSIAGTVFTFEVQYNSESDYFTVDLEREGDVLVTGEKLVYGLPLFVDIKDRRFPQVEIVPYDESGKSSDVTWSTLGTSVFLSVWSGESG